MKSASAQAVLDRIVSIFTNPRPMIQVSDDWARAALEKFLQYRHVLANSSPVDNPFAATIAVIPPSSIDWPGAVLADDDGDGAVDVEVLAQEQQQSGLASATK